MTEIEFGQVDNSYSHLKEYIPITLMDSLQLRNIFFTGKKVADIGSGTGDLTRKMAMRKAEVVGVDPSPLMVKLAKNLNVEKNFTIPYQIGSAEETGLVDSYFDMVTVMRAWEMFDRPKAIQEMKRILKENGHLIVIEAGVADGEKMFSEATRLLLQHIPGGLKEARSKEGPKKRLNTFPVEWFAEWQSEGFELRDFYKLNYTARFSKDEWIGQFEALLWFFGVEESIRKEALENLASSLQEKSYVIPHECNVCILRLKE